jgi:hypothetical protein
MSQQERSAEHLKAPFNATLIVPLPDPLTKTTKAAARVSR